MVKFWSANVALLRLTVNENALVLLVKLFENDTVKDCGPTTAAFLAALSAPVKMAAGMVTVLGLVTVPAKAGTLSARAARDHRQAATHSAKRFMIIAPGYRHVRQGAILPAQLVI
jgi:hypothetical protein